jgi:hypothetical protein
VLLDRFHGERAVLDNRHAVTGGLEEFECNLLIDDV